MIVTAESLSDEREKIIFFLLNNITKYRIQKMKTSKRCSQNIGFGYQLYNVWIEYRNKIQLPNKKLCDGARDFLVLSTENWI